MSDRPIPSRLESIQVLRGLAAASVLGYHAVAALFHNAGYPGRVFSNTGAAGVDLFFVISGFVMMHAHNDWFGNRSRAQEFLARRLIRVVPLYWLITALIATVLFLFPALFNTRVFDAGEVLYSLFFILNGQGANFGVLHGAGWSLCYEMYFYVLFWLLMRFDHRPAILALGAVILAGVAMGCLVDTSGTSLAVFTNPILLEFLFGIVLALALRRGIILPWPAGWLIAGVAAVIATGELGLVSSGEYYLRAVYWGLPGALIVWAAVSIERQVRPSFPALLLRIGDASYSLYLFHVLILPAMAKMWRVIGLQNVLPEMAFVLPASALCIAVSLLVHRHVELPITKGLRRWWERRNIDAPRTV